MVSVQKILGYTGKREALDRIVNDLTSDKHVKSAVLKAVKRGDIDPETVRISIKASEHMSIIEKLAHEAVKFAISEIHPAVNFAMRLDFDRAIDTVVLHKGIARQVKGVVNAIKGKGSIAVINLSDVKEKSSTQ